MDPGLVVPAVGQGRAPVVLLTVCWGLSRELHWQWALRLPSPPGRAAVHPFSLSRRHSPPPDPCLRVALALRAALVWAPLVEPQFQLCRGLNLKLY